MPTNPTRTWCQDLEPYQHGRGKAGKSRRTYSGPRYIIVGLELSRLQANAVYGRTSVGHCVDDRADMSGEGPRANPCNGSNQGKRGEIQGRKSSGQKDRGPGSEVALQDSLVLRRKQITQCIPGCAAMLSPLTCLNLACRQGSGQLAGFQGREDKHEFQFNNRQIVPKGIKDQSIKSG
jgi:hypothetical protein